MIWQEIAENGQQRPVAGPTSLACIEEAVTPFTLFALAVATAMPRPVLAASILFAHFYICRAERCENEIKKVEC